MRVVRGQMEREQRFPNVVTVVEDGIQKAARQGHEGAYGLSFRLGGESNHAKSSAGNKERDFFE